MIMLHFLKPFHWSNHNHSVTVNQGEIKEVPHLIAYYLIKLKVVERAL